MKTEIKKLTNIIIAGIALLLCGCNCLSKDKMRIAPEAECPNVAADTLFIAAMPSESKFIVEKYSLEEISPNLHAKNGIACITTGIGKDGVNSTLQKFHVSEKTQKINVGFCGSNTIKKGALCKISRVAKIENPQAAEKISESGVPCFSSDKFVEETDIKEPCAFDMELYYLREKFPNITAYKIVSDNLSHSEFKDFENLNPQGAWDEFFKEISGKISAKNGAAAQKNN